jgi:hypothetical protein
MVAVSCPHAAVPYTPAGGEVGTLIQDPPGSGLYVPDTSQVEEGLGGG